MSDGSGWCARLLLFLRRSAGLDTNEKQFILGGGLAGWAVCLPACSSVFIRAPNRRMLQQSLAASTAPQSARYGRQ